MKNIADSKYRPVRRCVSRYGMIEKALRVLRKEMIKHRRDNKLRARDVAARAKLLTGSIAMTLKFTKGIRHIGKGYYEFTGERIRVENAGG